MTIFLVIGVLFCVFEARNILKKKLKKEFVLFLVFASVALVMGAFYYRNPFKYSFVDVILKFLVKEYE